MGGRNQPLIMILILLYRNFSPMPSQKDSKDSTIILNQKYPLSHNMGVNINDNTCTTIENKDVEWISLSL